MPLRLLLFAILPIALTAAGEARPNDREKGLPFIRNYSPKEYVGQDQNWAVAQDRRGIVYAGNNDGVLIYDGVHWRTIKVSNGSAVRSLDVDAAGTVYVGARGEFGYLDSDESGALRYVSLIDRVSREDRVFKDVWRTMVTPEGVVFSSFDRLFRWNPQTGLKMWKPPGRFYRAFIAGRHVYVQQPESGLLRLDGESLTPAAGGARFSKDRIYCVAQWDQKLLVGSAAGFFLQEGAEFKPYATEADALLRKAEPYSCSPLPGGGVTIATLRNGALLLGGDGKLLRIIDRSAGLASNSVTFSYIDREGGLWLALVSGLARALAPSPLSFFDARAGLNGLVVAVARHGGSIYAGTSTGLYQLRTKGPGEFSRFEPVRKAGAMDNEGLQVWALRPTESDLLAGTSAGIYAVRGNSLLRIGGPQADVYDLFRSRRDPALIYASGNGVSLLREADGKWTDSGRLPGVSQAIHKTVEDASGNLWLGTDVGAAIHVDRSAEPYKVTEYGAGHGLAPGWVYPFLANGRVVFLTTAGIKTFDENSRRFIPDRVLAPLFAESEDKPSLLVEDRQGNLWVGAKTYGGLVRRRADGVYEWDSTPLRRMTIGEIYGAQIDADGVAWAGTGEGMVRYNPGVPKNYSVPFTALVRRVSDIGGGKDLHYEGAGEVSAPRLPFEDNSLRFEFAAPSFDDEARTMYRVFLENFDRGWSPWTLETSKDYTNIPAGSYVFRVEAKNLYGAVSGQGEFGLTILSPWYQSWWSRLLQLLAASAIVWALVRWRSRRLAEQNRWLQKVVDDRTAELRENNLKLTDANQALNLLNEEKNEFMGIAAHDLKNPLGAIRGYAEMLEEDAAEVSKEEVADTASRIKKSANLMFDLVSNLLDVNRIEQGKLETTLKVCDLSGTVKQAVEGYRARAQAKQIQLHYEEAAPVPPVMADASQLVQVIDNLISNAVKYSPAGKNIYVRVRQVGQGVRTEIRDEGPGISGEDQKRLFGKFARLTARPTAGEHSTGLGLAIVKKLVESMQGKIWCESELGKGATFILEMTMAAVETPTPV
ncbi:MAG TPA: ATP-binding protein [Bryobacteraceae bacterium]|nr:ATP-binding protein [Bryobacteraceae bacterium]